MRKRVSRARKSSLSGRRWWRGSSTRAGQIQPNQRPTDTLDARKANMAGKSSTVAQVRKWPALCASVEQSAPMELLDHRTYYRALQSHDARFDGHVFVGCTSTGIYCRPICPARTPKFENCRFFASAAAAQEAGFRPCLRCRPEIAPDLAFWRGTANTVSRALALIADGALDGEHADVEALAGRLGVGGRQLRRLFQRHLGASPIAVAQTRRVLFAKQLLHDTRLPMTEVALASGFSSVRRFNDTFRNLFRRPPSALRQKGATRRRAMV